MSRPSARRLMDLPAFQPEACILPDGRVVQPGAEMSVIGWGGRYRYSGWCHADGSLSVFGGPVGREQFRSPRPAQVRTVHRIPRTRQGLA